MDGAGLGSVGGLAGGLRALEGTTPKLLIGVSEVLWRRLPGGRRESIGTCSCTRRTLRCLFLLLRCCTGRRTKGLFWRVGGGFCKGL